MNNMKIPREISYKQELARITSMPAKMVIKKIRDREKEENIDIVIWQSLAQVKDQDFISDRQCGLEITTSLSGHLQTQIVGADSRLRLRNLVVFILDHRRWRLRSSVQVGDYNCVIWPSSNSYRRCRLEIMTS